MVRAWLAQADPRTLLLPDTLPSFRADHPGVGLYTPHNSGADLAPYFVATAYLTDRALYEGRMREMLRSEIRSHERPRRHPRQPEAAGRASSGRTSLFGAAEYCKDGMIALTELLGRTAWYDRMVDMTAAVMRHAPVDSAFGRLPDAGAEVNGDLLQTLTRLAPMTGDRRFLEWAERIGDAYVREVLPRNHGLPGYDWDFARHSGPDRLRLRDHGNEIVVGLVMLYALENDLGRERAKEYREPIARMLDRVLASTNADGMFFDEVRVLGPAAPEPADLRQLGLSLQLDLHLPHDQRRDALSRRRAARAAQPPEVPWPSTGRAAARTVTPTRSRARCTSRTASPSPRSSTSSSPRCRG